jgi:hypothetical protein
MAHHKNILCIYEPAKEFFNRQPVIFLTIEGCFKIENLEKNPLEMHRCLFRR